MVITALDKNNINKKRQLLPAQLPKGKRGQYGPFYITIDYFLKAVYTKKTIKFQIVFLFLIPYDVMLYQRKGTAHLTTSNCIVSLT